ncbi:MAG: hypothetical protein ACR2OH_11050 [Microthrixaceae bacterium]
METGLIDHPTNQLTTFPARIGRDLNGRERVVPDDLAGKCNVLLVAFKAQMQGAIDEWAPHLCKLETSMPGTRWYEVPCIARSWAPVRPFIDGGMAAAGGAGARKRTITIYGGLDSLTASVPSIDRRSLTLLVLDESGVVRGSLSGRHNHESMVRLESMVADVMTDENAIPSDGESATSSFDFDFEERYRARLGLIGVTPQNSRLEVGDGMLRCRFGRWSLDTPLDNITCATETGPYKAYRAIGARGSFADRGVTFGTTTRGGLCVEFREPVPGLLPSRGLRHPGATFTVADAPGLHALLAELCGLD